MKEELTAAGKWTAAAAARLRSELANVKLTPAQHDKLEVAACAAEGALQLLRSCYRLTGEYRGLRERAEQSVKEKEEKRQAATARQAKETPQAAGGGRPAGGKSTKESKGVGK
jgi:hypothetical protein